MRTWNLLTGMVGVSACVIAFQGCGSSNDCTTQDCSEFFPDGTADGTIDGLVRPVRAHVEVDGRPHVGEAQLGGPGVHALAVGRIQGRP